jgi:RNA polymerase sigma-70 factor (ECF subfamily)
VKSHAAFESLYRSKIRMVRKIISGHNITNGTADDIAQHTFLKVYEKLDTLKDERMLSSWIAAITRNSCLSHYRSQRFVELRFNPVDGSDSSSEYELGLWMDPETQEVDIDLEQNLRLLNQLLAKYAKEPRGKIARLFYLEGLSTQDISGQLNMPKNTVLSHLMLFRREMKTALLRLQHRSV